MAVNQVSLNFINGELSSLYSQLNSLLTRVNLFKANVGDAIGLSGLQAAPYSFSAADAQAIMNSITDMWHLFQVYQGLWFVASGATAGSGVPTANDATHFGYNFGSNVAKTGGPGY